MTTMASPQSSAIDCVLIEEDVHFTLTDLSRACQVDTDQLVALVNEGILQARGSGPQDWLFPGPTLRRARLALRVSQDLELNAAGTALVLDLLDEIDTLKARLSRAGIR
jgi:chaperone modulatory protein CbpM